MEAELLEELRSFVAALTVAELIGTRPPGALCETSGSSVVSVNHAGHADEIDRVPATAFLTTGPRSSWRDGRLYWGATRGSVGME